MRTPAYCPHCGAEIAVKVQILKVERETHPVDGSDVLEVTFEGMFIKHKCEGEMVR